MAVTRKKPVNPQSSEHGVGLQLTKKEEIVKILKKRTKQKFLTTNQKKYYELLSENQIVICSGPAGTGKSHVSIKSAIDLLVDPDSPYEKIMIVRPSVESSSTPLGSLPGDLREKMGPFVYSSISLLNKMVGPESVNELEKKGFLEIMSLSYLRGFNADNMIVIFEESQNSTPSEMKMLLTRIGFNSKIFVSGDIEQSDKFKKKEDSGLYDAISRLKDINNIGIFIFNEEDIVRNPLIKTILKRYED
jgi:phosphate starvation-inducible protein PhoH and related proteins